jgi:uncharacterized membrane protein (DUF106 family)
MNHSRTLKGTLLVLALSVTFPAMADNNWQTCKEKQQQIEQQLQYARANNNQKQINRLNRKKANIAQNCSNEDLRRKYTLRIDKLNYNLNDTQRKLDKAQAKKDSHKIAHLQNKLNENKIKLQQAKQDFARFEQAAKR